jgi:hypothetical protein
MNSSVRNTIEKSLRMKVLELESQIYLETI